MKTTAAALTLAGLATAQDTNVFSLITSHSGNVNIHLQAVHAHGTFFWAGGNAPDTTTYCPDTVQPNCPPNTNGTYLAELTGGNSASMYTEVPGGQQVYVDGETGALQYSIPHGTAPAGSVYTPFTYEPYGTGLAGFSIPGGAIACPEAGSYKIYSSDCKKDDKSACIGVGLVASPASDEDAALAWEYS